MRAICNALEVSRSNAVQQTNVRRIRPPRYVKAEDGPLLQAIREITDQRPSYGYRRVCAQLNRLRQQQGQSRLNPKRIYRIMKQAGLLLQRHTGKKTRTHEGQVITLKSNLRWCGDTFTIRAWNGEKVEVTFSLDCHDREAIAYVATAQPTTSHDVQELLCKTVEHRFGLVETLPHPIQWLTDNGPPFTAQDTRDLANALGLLVCTTPSYSPQSNGMAEAFVKTFKRDYAEVAEDLSTAERIVEQLPGWFEDYNEHAPHKGLRMQSPRQYRQMTVS